VGEILVARFDEDQDLYRSEVIESSPLTVRFVDYGNIQEIKNHRDAYPVLKKLLDLPAQAVKCSLIGVSPKGKSFEEWTLALGCILDGAKNNTCQITGPLFVFTV